MKFSVLIPVYNAEKYLDECLSSILNQTYKNFEIILVDDGSTDNSAVICDRYQKDYPETVKVIHQENQGQLVSRCNAINIAKSDYCIFMDADDLIVENSFEILLNSIEKHNSPDMIVYSFFYEYENGEKKCALKLCEDNTLFDNANKKECYQKFFECTLLNNVWTKCVKTKVLQSIDFDFSKFQKLRCAEDRLHSMLMIDVCETIAYIYIPLYRYKLVEGSVTRKFTVDSIAKFNTLDLYDLEYFYVKKWGLDVQLEQYQASYVSYMIYVMDLFYNNVSFREKKAILSYDWRSFLNEQIISGINRNNNLSDTHKRLWYMLDSEKYLYIKNYFLKRNLYKYLRNLKRKFLKGRK